MLNKKQKSQLRSKLFRHLDGIVVAPIAYALFKKGITDFLLEVKEISLDEISSKFDANRGYLNVALRSIASQSWIDYRTEGTQVFLKINEKSAIAFKQFELFEGVVDLLMFSGKFHKRKFEMEPFKKLNSLFIEYRNFNESYKSENSLVSQISEQIQDHILGHLIGPTIVKLGMGGMFHKYFMEASFSPAEYHKFPDSFTIILEFLSFLGWFEKKESNNFKFTDKGLFFAKRASAYGVTVSYMPMFRKIDDLLFGDPSVLWPENYSGPEIHVDREMNVWGSGGAHSAYFKQIDKIIIDIFNRPIEEQPKGILDMGCGNGAFLIHLFEVIDKHTLRGQILEEYPLFLVGVDYNAAALKVTRANLIQADIWAKVIWGDISDPQTLAHDIESNYEIQLKDLLNVRTFLDHNRIWNEDQKEIDSESSSTGAFVFRGERKTGDQVEANLKAHLSKWKPYISQFGLIVIELHTIHPSLTAQHLGKTAATAYDVTHGFSDQYILEIESFHKVIRELGLEIDENHFSKFPNSDLATVSINYLRE